MTAIEAGWLLDEAGGLYKCKRAEAVSRLGKKMEGCAREERIRPLAGRDTKGDEWRLNYQMKQAARRCGATWG